MKKTILTLTMMLALAGCSTMMQPTKSTIQPATMSDSTFNNKQSQCENEANAASTPTRQEERNQKVYDAEYVKCMPGSQK